MPRWAGFLLRVPRRRIIVASRIFLDRRGSQPLPACHARGRPGETIVLWHVHGIGLWRAAEVGNRRLYELLRRRFRSSFYRLIRASSDENTGWVGGGGDGGPPRSVIPWLNWVAMSEGLTTPREKVNEEVRCDGVIGGVPSVHRADHRRWTFVLFFEYNSVARSLHSSVSSLNSRPT